MFIYYKLGNFQLNSYVYYRNTRIVLLKVFLFDCILVNVLGGPAVPTHLYIIMYLVYLCGVLHSGCIMLCNAMLCGTPFST